MTKMLETEFSNQVIKFLYFCLFPGHPLQAKYFGPYEIESKISDVNYVVKTPGRRKKSVSC